MMSYDISYLRCNDCGKSFPIPRKKNSRRENGHIKDLWCPFCMEVKKMVEYKSNQYMYNMAGEML